MDVLAALAHSVGTSTPHLPLSSGMGLMEVIPLVNLLYLSTSPLEAENYKEAQAFEGLDGKVYFDFIDKETGNVLLTFVNAVSVAVQPPQITVVNPMTPGETVTFLFEPLKVDLKEELEFFNQCQTGVPLPLFDVVNELPFQLATLLNNYNYNGRWMAGSFGNLSTAGFEVVYSGPSWDAPTEFLVDYSHYVVILKLHHGEERGLICLRV